MTTLSIFQTTEFYIMATLAAAMVVGFMSKPSGRGPARQHLLAGDLSSDDGSAPAAVSLSALDDGTVLLRRHGLEGMTSSGAVSLAITIIGQDISIEERLSDGYSNDSRVDTATFRLDFLGADRYHVRYNSDATGLFAAFTFNNRQGYKVTKLLNR